MVTIFVSNITRETRILCYFLLLFKEVKGPVYLKLGWVNNKINDSRKRLCQR